MPSPFRPLLSVFSRWLRILARLVSALATFYRWLFPRHKKRKVHANVFIRVEQRWVRLFRHAFLLLLVTAPFFYWGRSLWKPSSGPPLAARLSSCPPASPIPLTALFSHPQRFKHRIFWVMGRLERGPNHCIDSETSPSAPCQQSCRAWLRLSAHGLSVRLRGIVRKTLLHCRGSQCSMKCKPLPIHRYYAFAAKILTISPRPQAPLTLWVNRVCSLSDLPKQPFSRWLPDPLFHTKKQKQ